MRKASTESEYQTAMIKYFPQVVGSVTNIISYGNCVKIFSKYFPQVVGSVSKYFQISRLGDNKNLVSLNNCKASTINYNL